MPRILVGVTCAFAVFVGLGVALGQALFIYPRIESHGRVVRLPDAAEQPREDSRICIDMTADGPPDAINPGVEKLARFLNIYAGAGARPATVQMTVVLHGDATTVALIDEAYAKRMTTKQNPNLPLLRRLRDTGVELLVCGQTVAALGLQPNEIAGEVQIAVSALTANVNRQMDGYAYIPLR